MKLVKLQVNNFMNLKAIDLTLDPDLVELSGKNGAGKSSVLNAICAAFQGGKAAVGKHPIRHGAEKAEIIARTEKWTARRVFTHKGTQLQVVGEGPNGEKLSYSSPQELLDQVWGDLTFDPLEFYHMKPKQQADVLMGLAGLDFAELDAQRQQAYTDRTAQNREVARLKSLLDSMPPLYPDAPDAPVKIEDVLAVQEDLERAKAHYEQHVAAIADARRLYERGRQEIAETEAAIVALQQKLETQQVAVAMRADHLRSLEAEIPQAVTEEQIQAVKQRLVERDGINQKVRQNQERRHTMDLLTAAREESDRLTERIQAIDQEKVERLATATFPLPGLSVADGVGVYHGIPLPQISTGEAMRISTAIAIALNPHLKVLFVRNASLLDREGLRIIVEMAKEGGYQVWMEVVADEPSGTGFYIEDGEVIATPEPVSPTPRKRVAGRTVMEGGDHAEPL